MRAARGTVAQDLRREVGDIIENIQRHSTVQAGLKDFHNTQTAQGERRK